MEEKMITHEEALAYFCENYKISDRHMTTPMLYNFTGYTAPKSYWLTNPSEFMRNKKIDALHIVPVLRFGNSVTQLINALRFCELYDIKRIVIYNHPLVDFDEFYIEDLCIQNVRQGSETDNALAGNFYFWDKLVKDKAGPTRRDERRIAETYLRNIFRKQIFQPVIQLADDDLVLHFRGGDVFQERINYDPKIRSSYLQPPCCFYEYAIAYEKQIGRLGRVVAVHEDFSNPCLAIVENYCSSHGIKFIAHSGVLSEDLSILIGASKLVFSYGSFLWSAGIMSSRLNCMYWFEDNHYAYNLRSTLSIEGRQVKDKSGSFLKRGEWFNTPDDVKRLKEFPLEAMFIKHVN
jgi:hypothetical protein